MTCVKRSLETGLGQAYFALMRQYIWISVVTHTLRLVLVTALMLLIPLTEATHAMPIGATMSAVGHDDMSDEHDMSVAGKISPFHSIDGASCRIMCLGWVQASEVLRPEAPVLALFMALATARFELHEGIQLSPKGRPPKTAPSV